MRLRVFFPLYVATIVVCCIIVSFGSRKVPKERYELVPYKDSMTLIDGNRIVGRLPYDSSLLSKTVQLDNQ